VVAGLGAAVVIEGRDESVLARALSATTASVSWTGRSAVRGAAVGAEVAGAAGADVAARGAGTAFWREARYPPPPAAATQATPSAANASRFESITTSPLDLNRNNAIRVPAAPSESWS
jgi:hypothetical protein